MKNILYILFTTIIISSAQNKLKDSDLHWSNIYYKAIDYASEGDLSSLKEYFELYKDSIQLGPLGDLTKESESAMNDLFTGKISKEAGQYIFKGLNAHFNKEDFSEVLFYLNRASGLQPNYYVPFLLRGRMHYDKKEYEKALFEFKKALEFNPNNYLNHYNLAQTHYRMENYDLAIDDLNNSIELKEGCHDCYMERFRNHYELELYDKALDDFEHARKIDSTKLDKKWLYLDVTAKLNDIGIRYKNSQDYKNSIRSYSESLKYDSRWIEPFLNRGIVFRLTKNYMLALKDFDKVLELEPENTNGHYYRALTYIDMDSLHKAEYNLIQVVSIDDKNAKAYFELAKIYFNQHKIGRAILNFRKTLEIDKTNVWAMYWLGNCYDNNQSYREALIWYWKFIDIVPEKYFKHKTIIQNRIKELHKLK